MYSESPIQILCKNYDFLVKNLKPLIATEILYRKKLLHQNDIENINIAPSQYAKNMIILEHLRCVDVPSLFVFCYELKKNDEQQYVGSFILDGKPLYIRSYIILLYVIFTIDCVYISVVLVVVFLAIPLG